MTQSTHNRHRGPPGAKHHGAPSAGRFHFALMFAARVTVGALIGFPGDEFAQTGGCHTQIGKCVPMPGRLGKAEAARRACTWVRSRHSRPYFAGHEWNRSPSDRTVMVKRPCHCAVDRGRRGSQGALPAKRRRRLRDQAIRDCRTGRALRRYHKAIDKDPVVRSGPLTIDLVSRAVTVDSRYITLTRQEYRLLHPAGFASWVGDHPQPAY
jgi:hypothetical protein